MTCKTKPYSLKQIAGAIFLGLCLFLNATATHAQESPNITVSGKISDNKGEGLPNVSVVVKGAKSGTVADVNGNYKISVPPNGTLIFSLIGFAIQEQVVNDRTTINISMAEDTKMLGEVVVTALGIKRQEKALTYSTQTIKASELTDMKDPNMMNSLTGKAAGVIISQSTSGAGGSVRVILRGNRSAQGDNQPLYVIDGVPIANTSPNGTASQPNSIWGNDTRSIGGRDGGDGISNINPDDIESISILRGASASALYGSQAANGVILITTKKGKVGVTNVNFSSSLMAETPQELPKLQNTYGQTVAGASQSWGPSGAAGKNNIKDFFRTGSTFINSIALSGGSEKTQTYFSYANTNAKGIMPTNNFNKHNVTLRENAKYGKLSIDGIATFVNQKTENRPSNGLYFNPLTGLYLFPRNLDFDTYKKNFEIFDVSRNLYVQNWPFNEDLQQNPYWILKRNTNADTRSRAILNLTAKYDITDWLFVQLRGTADKSADKFEQKIYASTQGALATKNGRYVLENTTTTLMYGDAILSANKTFNKIGVGALIGSSITDNQTDGDLFDSGNRGELNIPNYFDISNFNTTSLKGGIQIMSNKTHSQLQALFGTFQLSYDNKIFLDVTGRNDWASTLAFTPNASYFYPSVGLTGVLSDMFKLLKPISFAKVRLSYANVGSPVPPYVTDKLSILDNTGNVILNTEKPFTDLKPEMTKSLEIGTDWRFWDNRINFDLTLYKTNTINQYFSIKAPVGSGYSKYYINAGNIQNTGIELQAGVIPVRTENFDWHIGINYAKNVNKIVELSPLIKEFVLTEAGTNNYILKIKEGGSFGDIYAKRIQRDSNGTIYVDNTGKPLVADTFSYVGNSNPKFMLSMSNNFRYKNITLSFLIDGRFGGKVMSITQSTMDKYGVSKITGDARDQQGVDIQAIDKGTGSIYGKKLDPAMYYTTIGGRDGATGEYIYSATTVRLRELVIGYSLPQTIVGEGKVFKGATLSLIGRNLFYFYKKAPYDPDITSSTGNGMQGIDTFGLPATKTIGISIRFQF